MEKYIVDSIIEPQLEDRLCSNIRTYLTNIKPTLLAKIIANDELRQFSVDWIDNVNINHLIEETHEYKDINTKDVGKILRYYEVFDIVTYYN